MAKSIRKAKKMLSKIEREEKNTSFFEKFTKTKLFDVYTKDASEDTLAIIMTIMYSLKIHEPINILESGISYDGKDSLLQRLTALSSNIISFMASDSINELKSLYRHGWENVSHDDFLQSYQRCIDFIITYCHDFNRMPETCPNLSLINTIISYLVNKDVKVISNPYASIGTMAIPIPENVTYRGYTSTHTKCLIGEVIQDAFNVRHASMNLNNQSMKSQLAGCDGITSILPLPIDVGGVIATTDIKLYDSIFPFLLHPTEKLKAAVVIMVWEIGADDSFKSERKKMIELGIVDKVMELPVRFFADNAQRSVVLFLDYTQKHDTVEFIDGEKAFREIASIYYLMLENNRNLFDILSDTHILKIPYQQIIDSGYCLLPELYRYKMNLQPGQRWCPLEELVEIDESRYDNYNGNDFVSIEDFTLDIKKVIYPIEFVHKTGHFNGYKTTGKRLLMNISDTNSIRLAKMESKKPVGLEWLIYSMKVDESKISIDYLAYVLLNDESFHDFMEQTCRQYDSLDSDILKKRCIPIYDNLEKQRDIVNNALGRKERRIVWAENDIDAKLTDEVISHCQQKGLCITGRANDFPSLQNLINISMNTRLESSHIDAIVMDPSLKTGSEMTDDSMSAFERLMYLVEFSSQGNWSCPIFFCTDLPIQRLNYYFNSHPQQRRFFNSNYVFSKNLQSRISLLDKIADTLPNDNIWTTQMKSLYHSEYIAAQWVDENLSINSLDIIAEEKGRDPMFAPIKGFDKIRNVVHQIIIKLQNIGIVPGELNPGAVPSFWSDGFFRDSTSEMTFIQLISIIPTSLAKALTFFIKMANSSVHSEGTQNTETFSGLRGILVDIMMEFEKWYYQKAFIESSFSNNEKMYWQMISDYEFTEFTDSVKVERINNKEYFYSKNVHLKYKPGLKEGSTVNVKKVTCEQQLRKVNDNLIVFYAQEYDLL